MQLRLSPFSAKTLVLVLGDDVLAVIDKGGLLLLSNHHAICAHGFCRAFPEN